jgi:hypothetical protein
MTRPSLKITRQTNRSDTTDFIFEVWSPFTGTYQPAASIKNAMQRLEELAALICQMRLQRHPKQEALADVPDVREADDLEWAEFRVNAATFRSYDMRRFDRVGWTKATGLRQAAEMTCAKVGYALPEPSVS